MGQTSPSSDDQDQEDASVPGEKPEEKPSAPAKKAPAWMGQALIGVFILVAVGVGYILWLIATTFHLIRDDFYLKDFANGRVVEKQTYEDPFGWGSELMIDKKPDKPARIRFLLRDKNHKPLTDAAVDITFIHPGVPHGKTAQGVLKMNEPGVYRGEIELPEGGLWEARVQVKEGGNAYQVTERVTLP